MAAHGPLGYPAGDHLPRGAGAVQEALEPAELLQGLPGVATQGAEVPFPQVQVSPQEAALAELLTLAILLPPPRRFIWG